MISGQGHSWGPSGILATDVQVVSSTKITAVTGGGARAAVWNVYVTNSGGTSHGSAKTAYQYY